MMSSDFGAIVSPRMLGKVAPSSKPKPKPKPTKNTPSVKRKPR